MLASPNHGTDTASWGNITSTCATILNLLIAPAALVYRHNLTFSMIVTHTRHPDTALQATMTSQTTTPLGINALVDFIKASGAFTTTGQPPQCEL